MGKLIGSKVLKTFQRLIEVIYMIIIIFVSFYQRMKELQKEVNCEILFLLKQKIKLRPLHRITYIIARAYHDQKMNMFIVS